MLVEESDERSKEEKLCERETKWGRIASPPASVCFNLFFALSARLRGWVWVGDNCERIPLTAQLVCAPFVPVVPKASA